MMGKFTKVYFVLCLSFKVAFGIFGAQRASIVHFPFQVSIRDFRLGGHICSGTLYKEKFVITGAQCILHRDSYNLHVRAGTADAKNGGSLTPVLSVVPHPDFDYNTRKNDIAVLVLVEPLERTQEQRSIDELSTSLHVPWEEGVVSGWGLSEHNVQVLRRLSVPILSTDQCITHANIHEEDQVFCAGDVNKKAGPCRGDNGAPLVISPGGGTVLLGLVSWNPLGCDRVKNPTVYTNVGPFAEWIETVTSLYP